LEFNSEKADQILIKDFKEKKLEPGKYWDTVTELFNIDKIKQWPPDNQRWLLVNDKEWHIIAFRSA